MTLHPAAQTLLEQMKAMGAQPTHLLTPEQARIAGDMSMLAGQPEEVANVENLLIPGPNGEIPIRIYTPEGSGPFQALLYYHGGGWVIGNLDSVDVPCRMLANETGSVVISVDYRLAPEHPFPQPIEDAYAALEWVAENSDSIQVDKTRISVSGDSAGGNLAAVVSLMAKDRNGPNIHYQILYYPAVHHNFQTQSYEENKEGFFLTKESMEWFWNHYLQDRANGNNPYASPMLAEDVSDLPPALIFTAEYDPLRDEGEAYGEKLREAGIDVTIKRYDGIIHGFLWMPVVFEQARDAIKLTAEKLKVTV